MLHNLRSDKSLLCDPSLALNRDSCKGLKNSSKTGGSKETSANDQTAHKLVALCDLVESQKNTLQRLTHCLSEADKQRCDLLKDLEEERLKNEELAKVVLSASSPLEDDPLKPIIGNVQFLIDFMTVLYTRWRFDNYTQDQKSNFTYHNFFWKKFRETLFTS